MKGILKKMKTSGIKMVGLAGVMAGGLTACNNTQNQQLAETPFNNVFEGRTIADVRPCTDSATVAGKIDSVNRHWFNEMQTAYVNGIDEGYTAASDSFAKLQPTQAPVVNRTDVYWVNPVQGKTSIDSLKKAEAAKRTADSLSWRTLLEKTTQQSFESGLAVGRSLDSTKKTDDSLKLASVIVSDSAKPVADSIKAVVADTLRTVQTIVIDMAKEVAPAFADTVKSGTAKDSSNILPEVLTIGQKYLFETAKHIK